MAVDPLHLSVVRAVVGAQHAERVVDAVPAAVRDAARRAFAERDRHAEVLPLGYDSLLADAPADQPRRLMFADPAGASVTVTVHPASSGEAVEVEITSLGCSLVEVKCGGTTLLAETPGQTLLGPAPHGLFSAVLQSEDGRRLRTSWLRV